MMKGQRKHEEVRKQLRKEVRVNDNNDETQIKAQSIKQSLLPSGTTVGAQCLQSL